MKKLILCATVITLLSYVEEVFALTNQSDLTWECQTRTQRLSPNQIATSWRPIECKSDSHSVTCKDDFNFTITGEKGKYSCK